MGARDRTREILEVFLSSSHALGSLLLVIGRIDFWIQREISDTTFAFKAMDRDIMLATINVCSLELD